MRDLKIFGLSFRESGCGYHRVFMPLNFMEGVGGVITDIPQPQHLSDDYDMILYNRTCAFDSDWAKVKADMGVKVVMDLDDYWELPPSHVLHHHYKMVGKHIVKNIEQADMVTCTNDKLKSFILPYNSNVHVIPNAIPFGRNQFTDDRLVSDRVRIFWAGGSTHEKDLEILRNPIKKLHTYRNKIKMVIGGYTDTDSDSHAIWRRMFSSFTDGGTLPYMKIHGTLPFNYMDMFANADIMVVPLQKSDWHGCKSNLKLLEAAAKRIPVICSKVEPYSNDIDAPVLWVEKQSQWFEYLNLLINNPGLRDKLGNEMYAWATKTYELTDINKHRRTLYASLCEA